MRFRSVCVLLEGRYLCQGANITRVPPGCSPLLVCMFSLRTLRSEPCYQNYCTAPTFNCSAPSVECKCSEPGELAPRIR